MNEDEIKGGLRYVKGKIEKAAGDLMADPNLKADGIVDQISGGTRHLYGNAKHMVQNAVDSAPAAIDETQATANALLRKGHGAATDQIRQNPWMWVALVGIGAFALAHLTTRARFR